MKVQVTCKSKSNATLVEQVIVKYNEKPLNPNPVAYQNKWLQKFFGEEIAESVMGEIQELKENCDPKNFESVLKLKFQEESNKFLAANGHTLQEVTKDNIEDCLVLPTPVCFMKGYYSKIPAYVVENFLKHVNKDIAVEKVSANLAFILGVLHDCGIGFKVDHAKALEYYKRAKKMKYFHAYYTLFDIYSRKFKTYGIPQDNEKGQRQIVKMMIYSIGNYHINPLILGDKMVGYLRIAYAFMDIYSYTCDYIRSILNSPKDDVLTQGKKLILQIITDTKSNKELVEKLKAYALETKHPFLLCKCESEWFPKEEEDEKVATEKVDKAIKIFTGITEAKEESYYKCYAFEQLGQLYEKQKGIETALPYYKEAATGYHTFSIERMGTGFVTGILSEKNPALGEQYFSTAAILGNTGSLIEFLFLCAWGKESKLKAYKLAIEMEMLEKYISNEDLDLIQLIKAKALIKGEGVACNYSEAMTILRVIPEKKMPLVLYYQGLIYEKTSNELAARSTYGYSLRRYEELVVTYKEVHSVYFYILGKHYLKGKGCDANLRLSLEYIEKAATAKCCKALNCLFTSQRAKGRLAKMLHSTKVAEEIKS